jgi:hypothetical protein
MGLNMIFQFEYWTLISNFFNWVAQSAGIMVFVSGFVALTWLGYERKRRGSFLKRDVDLQKFSITKFLRILSYTGILIGIFCIWSGIMGLILDIPPSFRYRDISGNEANFFTYVFLIVVGIVMILKPISDLPWAGIIGLFAGAVTAFTIALVVPDTIIAYFGTIFKWIIIVSFIITAIIVGILAKFYLGILMTISKILSWPPIAFLLAIFCFIQGIALWGFGVSIPNLL